MGVAGWKVTWGVILSVLLAIVPRVIIRYADKVCVRLHPRLRSELLTMYEHAINYLESCIKTRTHLSFFGARTGYIYCYAVDETHCR